MERILCNQKIFEIIPFDYSSPVLFFPVRHHSPACSYHLLQTIRHYQPDCILVEGPQNADRLIPVLTDENTVLPVAFYYFYKDSGKYVSDDADDYKCYYPFLATSPEYNALQHKQRNYKKVQLAFCRGLHDRLLLLLRHFRVRTPELCRTDFIVYPMLCRIYPKKPVTVAVSEQRPYSAAFESRLGAALGIKLHELDAEIRHSRQERDIMLLAHGMLHANKELVLDLVNDNSVLIIRCIGLDRRKSNAAAAYYRLADSSDHVAADRADVEFTPEQIRASVDVLNVLTGHKLDNRNAESLCEGLEQRDIGKALTCLPFAHSLAAHMDHFCQFLLGELL